MNWWQAENFETKKLALRKRAIIMRAVRNFFDNQGFTEVETPTLQVMPCADMHIHGFKTEYFGPDLKKQRDYYLHTSPEFEMKKLLVAGMPRIYQICKVFRNGENTRLHSPEFTMLEWYRVGADYRDIMNDCEAFVNAAAKAAGAPAYAMPFERLSVTEAFARYADIDLIACLDDTEAFKKQAQKQNIRTIEADCWDDVFHAVMAEKIEPKCGASGPSSTKPTRPTFLYNYPASMACLSKKAKDPRFSERFELYIKGVEIANAFTELTDAAEQRKRFEEEMAAKQKRYGFAYPLDEGFLAAIEHGMPECSGIALGLDRLIMLLTGAECIEDVMWTAKP